MYTMHNIPGSQYLEYLGPGNLLLGLYSFAFTASIRTGSRVDDATPKNTNMGVFAPAFASIIVVVIVIVINVGGV